MKNEEQKKKRPQVKFGKPNLPFKIVDIDKVEAIHPRRIMLTDKQMCKQLGIEKDLLKFYLKTRALHPLGKNEAAIFGGCCAEDIAAMSIVSAGDFSTFQGGGDPY